ncbi:MAG: hypothetical protein ACK4QW_06865 [Alphaproteobacteria bacterium]
MKARASILALVVALTAGLLAAPATVRADGPGFVGGFEDLPLMPGLWVDERAGVLFEKPSGRIVEAVAGGTVAAADIRSFYGATLPELGWSPVPAVGGAGLLYRRSAEMLHIEIRDDRRARQVRFFLTPG